MPDSAKGRTCGKAGEFGTPLPQSAVHSEQIASMGAPFTPPAEGGTPQEQTRALAGSMCPVSCKHKSLVSCAPRFARPRALIGGMPTVVQPRALCAYGKGGEYAAWPRSGSEKPLKYAWRRIVKTLTRCELRGPRRQCHELPGRSPASPPPGGLANGCYPMQTGATA